MGGTWYDSNDRWAMSGHASPGDTDTTPGT